jgi:hypothetical protein
MKRRIWKIALLLVVPLVLYASSSSVNRGIPGRLI